MRQNQLITITGIKVVLVPYKKIHVEKYHKWMENEELRDQTASELLSLDEEYRMQKSWAEDDDKCTFIILDSAALVQNGKSEVESMVGDVNLFFNDSDDKQSAEIEIMIAEINCRGKGLGKEAVLLMIKYGYEQLHIKRYIAKIGESNANSLHLFEKIGFQKISYTAIFKEITLELIMTEDILASLQNLEYNMQKSPLT